MSWSRAGSAGWWSVRLRGAAAAAASRRVLAETLDGFVRRVGLQNRGVSAAVRRYGQLWPRMGCPGYRPDSGQQSRGGCGNGRAAHPARMESKDSSFCANRRPASGRSSNCCLRSFLLESDLPVLVKLPLTRAAALAPVAVAAGAAGVVVGSPPMGAAMRDDGQGCSAGRCLGWGSFR